MIVIIVCLMLAGLPVMLINISRLPPSKYDQPEKPEEEHVTDSISKIKIHLN